MPQVACPTFPSILQNKPVSQPIAFPSACLPANRLRTPDAAFSAFEGNGFKVGVRSERFDDQDQAVPLLHEPGSRQV